MGVIVATQEMWLMIRKREDNIKVFLRSDLL